MHTMRSQSAARFREQWEHLAAVFRGEARHTLKGRGFDALSVLPGSWAASATGMNQMCAHQRVPAQASRELLVHP